MLDLLDQKIAANSNKVDEWLMAHIKAVGGPIYSSVDVRNAGFKLAPVDTNIFPAGFNNLCPSYLRAAAKRFSEYVVEHFAKAKKILIIPENHSRNFFYYSNVLKIKEMIEKAGFEVEIGTLRDDFEGNYTEGESVEGVKFKLCKIKKNNNRLFVEANDDIFEADVVVLNNDLSDGIPELLKNLEQPLLPAAEIGWHTRTKSEHFSEYKELVTELADLIDIDPWLIDADFAQVRGLDFGHKEGLEEVAKEVDALIGRVKMKYQYYGVESEPYAFIKNDAGTYGMAITTAKSGDELLEMNRKKRNKMNVGKGSVHVDNVIIQEGVPTVDRVKGLVAEPVVYLVGNKAIGGFFRLNEQVSDRGNLNSKGMKFSKLCFHETLGYANDAGLKCDLDCLAKMYRLIAEIASVAAGYEILGAKELLKQN